MWPPTGLIPWFSKTEGNTYATLLHHPFLFKGKPTHAQEVAIITSDGVVFNGEHHYVDHIYYMIHVRPFGLSVPRPYLHMLGSSSLTRVFCVCKNWLAPVVCERRAYHTRSSRGVSARQTIATVHTHGEHLYLEI